MGGWASDTLAKRGVSSGGWAARQLATRGAQPEPDNSPIEVGVTLEGLDADAAARGEKIPEWKDPRSNWNKPWDEALADIAPTVSDTVTGAAKGLLTGLGAQVDTVASRQAETRSPKAFGAAKLGSEIAGQAALLPQSALGGMATGMIGGALSGYGNAKSTDPWDRALEALPSAAMGAGGGVIAERAAPVLGSVAGWAKGKAGEYAEKQATHGLLNRLGDEAPLEKLDATGGRQQWYDDMNRLGIKGKPFEAKTAAGKVADAQGATRDAIEGRMADANVQIDPKAAASAMRGANPYPGVGRMDRAVGRAANEVAQSGPGFGPMDVKRQYYGANTNFASGSPNAVIGQRMHGAVNNEIEDAFNLAEPGAGSQWRQAGHDQHVGIEAQKMAQKGFDADLKRPLKTSDWLTLGTLPLANSNRHAVAEGAYNTGRKLANAGSFVADWGQGAAQSVGGNVAGVAGGNLADSVLGSLSQGGQDLGEYRDQFAQAAASPDMGAVQNLITRLTMSDPKFRTTLLPRLREQAGG